MRLAYISGMDRSALALKISLWFPKFMPLNRMFSASLDDASYSSRQARILRHVWDAQETIAS
jgi:hypothetical protein